MKYHLEFEGPEDATYLGEAIKRHIDNKPKAQRQDEIVRILGLVADRLAPWDKRLLADAIGGMTMVN